MDKKSFLVTGASGFIGQHLVDVLLRGSDAKIRILVRPAPAGTRILQWPSSRVREIVGDLTQPESLSRLCDGVDTIYHLAGYAHAEDSDQPGGQQLHQRITVEGTRTLVEQAIAAGVGGVVFASSVKALGEGGDAESNEDSRALPTTSYGRAKLEAEELILGAGRQHGFHAAVLRLPLVYGHNNKGNIPRMIAAIDRGRFPPLPEVHNKRSMVHVDDVVRALVVIANDARANGQRYLVTDGRNYSTRELYELICCGLGKPVPRWSVPVGVLRALAKFGDLAALVAGRRLVLDSSLLAKLFGSACYSSEKIQRELGFRPTRTLADSLVEMVDHYRRRHQS